MLQKALKSSGERGKLSKVSDQALLVAWGELQGKHPSWRREIAIFRVELEADTRGMAFSLRVSPFGGYEAVNETTGQAYPLPISSRINLLDKRWTNLCRVFFWECNNG